MFNKPAKYKRVDEIIKKFPISRFTDIKKVGEGSYGLVTKAYDNDLKRVINNNNQHDIVGCFEKD